MGSASQHARGHKVGYVLAMNICVILFACDPCNIQRFVTGHDVMLHAEPVHLIKHVLHSPCQEQGHWPPGFAYQGICHCYLRQPRPQLFACIDPILLMHTPMSAITLCFPHLLLPSLPCITRSMSDSFIIQGMRCRNAAYETSGCEFQHAEICTCSASLQSFAVGLPTINLLPIMNSARIDGQLQHTCSLISGFPVAVPGRGFLCQSIGTIYYPHPTYPCNIVTPSVHTCVREHSSPPG